MMIASERSIVLLLLSAVFLVCGYYVPPLIYFGGGTVILLAAGAWIEWLVFQSKSSIAISRRVPPLLVIEAANRITLQVENRSDRSVSFRIHDEPPDEFEMRDVTFHHILAPRHSKTFHYEICPGKRGNFLFHDISLEIEGTLFGLVRRRLRYELSAAVKVYPNYKQLRAFELQSLRYRLNEPGMKKPRRYGMGTEYESLREYTQDDEYRRINWKASARSAKLIATNYQQERSQNIMILIDSGRLMGSVALGLSKLDHAINAATMLSHVCLQRNDKVGIMAFAGSVRRFLLPRKDKFQIARIAESLYDVPVEWTEPDYTKAFEYVRLKQRQRSLVLCFTEILDRYASQILINNLTRMYPKHLPVCILMKDRELDQILRRPVTDRRTAYEKGVTAELLREREEAIAFVRSQGVMVIDTLPEHLNAEVINTYLDIKSKGKL